MSAVAIVTGGSSGVGRCTAGALIQAGYRVYEFSRREIVHADGTVHMSVDVTDEAAVRKAVRDVERREGRADLLICNAGFGISGAAEFTENKDARRLLDVNLFGVVNVVKAVVPIMRRQGSGKIICIGSVAAPIAIPFQAWYSVSKAAVCAYALALREEVRPFGIQVCAILPGDIRTGFTAAREKTHVGDDIYGGRIARSVSAMEKDEQNGMMPEKAAARICTIAGKRHFKPTYAVGLPYSCAVVLARLLPGRIVSGIVGILYAR